MNRRALWLVTRRELRTRVVSRTFLIGLGVTVALIFGVFGMGSVLGGDDDPIEIAVTGSAPANTADFIRLLADATGRDVELTAADPATARQLLDDEEVAGVLQGSQLLMRQTDDEIVSLVAPAFREAVLIGGLDDLAVDDAAAEELLTASAGLEIVETEPDPDSGARRAVSFASVILMFAAIQVAGSYIMLGVFEEKSTKVVELVLSSIPARYLLGGKVIGIGVLGIAQVLVMAASALAAASLFGSSALPALNATLIGTAVIWFVLGYLLYGAVFAAGASLAPRQEDAQSTLGPISIVLMVSYFAAIFTASDPSGTAATVLSWIPLTAPFVMPGRIAENAVATWELMAVIGVTTAAAVAVFLLAERIYVRSVIHTDRTLGWREAWSLDT